MLCHVSMQGIERPASVISRCAAFAIAGSKMLVFSESFGSCMLCTSIPAKPPSFATSQKSCHV